MWWQDTVDTITYTCSPVDKANCLAVILVGGQGKRLGGCQKGLIQIQQQRMIDYQLAVTQKVAQQTVVLGVDKNSIASISADYPHVKHWPDLYQQVSPLSGIKTALYASPVPWVWIFANDLPNIDLDHCQTLSMNTYQYYLQNNKYPLVTFYYDQWIHPLAALWHRDALPMIPPLNSKHLSLQRFCKQIPHLAIPITSANSLHNINTMEDLQNFTAFLIDK